MGALTAEQIRQFGRDLTRTPADLSRRRRSSGFRGNSRTRAFLVLCKAWTRGDSNP